MPEVSAPVVLGGVSLGAAALGLGVASAGAGVGDGDVSAADGVAGALDSVVVPDGGEGSLTGAALRDVVLEVLVDFFGIAFGAELGSVVTVAVAGAGVGATAADGVESASTVDFVSVAVVVSVAGVDGAEDARLEAGAAAAATGFEATSWLNTNAPAITMAMITPKAIGKFFTGAS